MSGLDKRQIAREIALDLPDGATVNLGIGLPILVAAELDENRDIIVHSENGVLGMGGPASVEDADDDLVNAAKGRVLLRVGGSYISHVDSFALIRGAHVDVSVMGAFQVSGSGDLANWWNGEGIPGVGGAMDLAVGARQVFVAMWHTTPSGEPKIVPSCTYPLTSAGCVHRIYTNLGIFVPQADGSVVATAVAAGVTRGEILEKTGVPVRFDSPTALPRS